MRWRAALVGSIVGVAGLVCCGPGLAQGAPSYSQAAGNGIRELLGTGDGSPVAWDAATGLWDDYRNPHGGPYWWQSAVAVLTLARFGQRTGDPDPAIQHVLVRTYQLNVSRPATRNFITNYMDDTGWWGLAWLAASQYELSVRHDASDAARFLNVAEADASHIAAAPRPCGGVEWELASAPNTIANAEFIALTAGLARYQQAPGPFHDPRGAARWLSAARADLGWFEQSGLVDMATGSVSDHMGNEACQVHGGPLTYDEGLTADALVQLGAALSQPAYYGEAQTFLAYTTDSANGMVSGGVLQDQCEALTPNCAGNPHQLDFAAFKGLFVASLSDWTTASGNPAFESFIDDQANAIIANDILGASSSSPGCDTPHDCQFGFSWARPEPTMVVTVGTQESALLALTAALP
jgi:hypothetical protein